VWKHDLYQSGSEEQISEDSGHWQHDKFQGDQNTGNRRVRNTTGILNRIGRTTLETNTKIFVDNLDYNVTNSELQELMEAVGDVKMANISYDKSGRSQGRATVTFTKRLDAQNAIKKYNGVELDGKKLEVSFAKGARSGAIYRELEEVEEFEEFDNNPLILNRLGRFRVGSLRGRGKRGSVFARSRGNRGRGSRSSFKGRLIGRSYNADSLNKQLEDYMGHDDR